MGTIFITHHHDDHTAGLGTLMSAAWDNQRTKPINVYGPPRTEELVKAAVQYFTISAEIRIADGGRTIPIEVPSTALSISLKAPIFLSQRQIPLSRECRT